LRSALNDFLEDKRSKFPRFYFIGDDDLLEILGQAQVRFIPASFRVFAALATAEPCSVFVALLDSPVPHPSVQYSCGSFLSLSRHCFQNPAVIENHLKKLFAGIHRSAFSSIFSLWRLSLRPVCRSALRLWSLRCASARLILMSSL
jgi:hypothetical protein